MFKASKNGRKDKRTRKGSQRTLKQKAASNKRKNKKK